MTGWRRRVLRAGLGLLAVTGTGVGLWAVLLPLSFYRGFPLPGHAWVARLPAYNAHLVTDVGALNLALAFGLAVAALTLEPLLVRTSLIGYQLYAIPHLVFHADHLAGFPPVDAAVQTALLCGEVVAPLALLALTMRGPSRAAGTDAGSARGVEKLADGQVRSHGGTGRAGA